MDGTKSLLASKTFWGALLALLGVVGPAFGLSKLGTWAANPATLDACMQVGGVLGAILAMYGRATATKTIGKADPNTVKALAFIAFLPFLGLGGCANVITQLEQGTTALINFNNALITLNLTIVGNLKAQAQQLAPLVCGGFSLGATIASNPALAQQVNGYLASHKGQNNIVVVAQALCDVAGLPTTVNSVPAAAVTGASP